MLCMSTLINYFFACISKVLTLFHCRMLRQTLSRYFRMQLISSTFRFICMLYTAYPVNTDIRLEFSMGTGDFRLLSLMLPLKHK